MVRQPGTLLGDGKVRAGAGQNIQDGGWTDDEGQREVFRFGVQTGENWVSCFSHHAYFVKMKSIDLHTENKCAKWENIVRLVLVKFPPL